MKFNGKEVEIIKGDHKGKKGYYLGTDGYTGYGVTCKILLDNEKTVSFIWDAFIFKDSYVQEEWTNRLGADEDWELDFDS